MLLRCQTIVRAAVAAFFAIVFSQAALGQSCGTVAPLSVTVTTTPACSTNASATVTFSNGTAPYTYTWSPNVSTTNSASGLAPGTYSVTIKDGACHLATGPELINNGNFSAGNTGFSSSYNNCQTPNCLWTPVGRYAVGTSGQSYHNLFRGFDHTTGSGNFMIINGSAVFNASIWCQTIPVTPNTNYVFSTWVASMHTNSPALLQFSINGTQLASPFSAPSGLYTWIQFCTTWNSGANTTANICIINKNTTGFGNDFGLDDISFTECRPTNVTFTIPASPPVSTTMNSTPTNCGVPGSASVTATTGTPGYTYLWSNGLTTAAISGQSAGNYSVTVTDAAGCSNTNSVTINATTNQPVAAFSNTSPCVGVNTQFTNGSTSPTGDPITNWNWSFAGGSPATSTGQNPSVTYPAGTYSATLVVTTQSGCIDSITQVVTVNPKPVPAFTSSVVCFPNSTQFTDQSTGPGTQWSWNFGDGTANSTQQSPTHTYAPGNYNVTFVVTSAAGCADSVTQPITVNPKPVPDFSPTVVCFNTPTVFTDMSAGSPNQWNWNFGDGSANSTQQNPTHTYPSPGTYSITLVVTNAAGCSDSITKSVTVAPQPVPGFSPTTVCLNTPTVFTDQSTGSSTQWSWNFGDGGTSSQQNPSHTYAATGTYSVTLIVSTQGGCEDSITQLVTVNPSPVAAFASTTICFNNPTVFTNQSTGPGTQWSWNFGDGSANSTQQSPTHTYAPGNYNVTFVVTSAAGCVDSVTQPVTINPKPVPDFSPTVVCFNTPTVFTDQSTVPGTQWSWSFGDGSANSTQQNPTHTYAAPGTYNITFIVTTQAGCIDSITKAVTVNPQPVAAFASTTVCFNNPTVFTDQSTSGTQWSWNFGDGTSNSTQQSTSHTYSASGTYNVTFVVTSAAGCADSITQPVTVDPLPVPDFSPTVVCFNTPTVFTDMSTGSPNQWNWNFGDGSANSAQQNPTHTYPSPGTYSITLVVTTAAGCVDSITKSVSVSPQPVPNFLPTTVCHNTPTVFTDQSTGGTPTQWTWYFGDGATSALQNPSHTYAATGTYSVTLHIAIQGGCMDSITQLVTVNPTPVAVFSPTTVCFNNPTLFTDQSTGPGTQWSWNFGDGSANSTQQSTTHTYSAPGTYNVTFVVTSSAGCADSVTHPVTVNPTPAPAFIPTVVCFNDPTVFTDQSTGSPNQWSWDFGDGTPVSTQQNPIHVYSSTGTYSVTLNVTTALGCTNAITQMVTVNPVPQPAFTSGYECFNNPTSFTDISTGTPTQWDWNFGDGNSSTQQSPSHTYATSGTFSVTLIISNTFGCKDTAQRTTVVNPLPVALFNALPVCLGEPTCFTDASTVSLGAITVWSWNFGDPGSGAANTSSLQNPCHTFTGSGQFSVILTATSDSGCQSNTILPVTVNPLPVAGMSVQNACFRSSSVFSDATVTAPNDSISTYVWNFGDGSSISSQQDPTHTYPAPGTYTVSLIVTSAKGCKDTVTDITTLYQLPVADFSGVAKGCSPVCQTFTDSSTSADGTIIAWQWNFPGGTPSSSISSGPAACWIKPGTYDVEFIVTTSYGCKDTLRAPNYVEVYSDPIADFLVAPPKAAATEPEFSLSDMWSSDVVNWHWDFGDNSYDSINTDPVHSYSASVTSNDFYSMEICLNVQNVYGCWDSVCKKVEILPEFQFYMPNSFTPNDDHLNDSFFGKGRGIKEYHIVIFDRWGNLIWECEYKGSNVPWDAGDGMPFACTWPGPVAPGGSDMSGSSGRAAQEDVYVWKVGLMDVFNKRHSYVGHVTIVK